MGDFLLLVGWGAFGLAFGLVASYIEAHWEWISGGRK